MQLFILRRTKTQVFNELPQCTDIIHRVTMRDEGRHWYDALRQQAVDMMAQRRDEIKPLQVLTEVTRLRLFYCHPAMQELGDTYPKDSKLSVCLEIIDEMRESRHKALVFSQFFDHLYLLHHAYDERDITYQYPGW